MRHSILPPLGDPELHFWITHSVARAMGVSFTEAMARGAISPKDYAEMVAKCQKCPHVEACVMRLGRPEALGAQPAYCQNKEALDGLAERV